MGLSANNFIGSSLRLARLFNGLTLQELGEKVVTSRQYIQRLEMEKDINPTQNLVRALAEVLKVEPSFFYAQVAEFPEELFHFRKRQTTPLHIKNQARALATIFSLIISYLESNINFPDINFDNSTVNDDDNEIECIAQKYRHHWKLTADAPIANMVRVSENNGVIVTAFGDISEKIDAFSYWHMRGIIVRNTAKESPSRARFDIAHELGHLIMHQGIEPTDERFEDQANQFASAFLFPRHSFISEYPRGVPIRWQQLIALKLRWGVSLQAIIRRAFDLRIISAVEYRNAFVHIGKQGWKTNEPSDDKIPIEYPELLQEAFTLLLSKGIHPKDIAKSLNICLDIINKFGFDFIPDDSNDGNLNLVHFPIPKR